MTSLARVRVGSEAKIGPNVNSLQRGDSSHWAEIIFFLFCMVSIIGISPFSDRTADITATISPDQQNWPRQFLNIAFFLFFFAKSFSADNREQRWTIPTPLLFFLLLAFCSLFWSLSPDRTFRRSAGLFIAIYTVFAAVRHVGLARSVRLLTQCLALVALVDLASIFLIRNAVHLSNGFDAEAVVGNWRGMFFHKNVAGPITAISLPFFAHAVVYQRRRLYWIPFVAGLIFLIGTQSKTGLNIGTFGGVLFCLFFLLNHARLGNSAIRFGISTVALLMVIFGAFWYDDIVKTALQPDFLTGRGAIWAITVQYIKDHFWLGSGYGAFWQLGDSTPALHVTELRWLQQTAQTHNGYLEIASNVGVPGVVLAIYASIIFPVKLALKCLEKPFVVLCLQIVLLSLVLNFTESRMFQGFREEWIIHLIAIAVIWQSYKEHLEGKETQ